MPLYFACNVRKEAHYECAFCRPDMCVTHRVVQGDHIRTTLQSAYHPIRSWLPLFTQVLIVCIQCSFD
jgi:hypothetical protein